MQPERRIVKRCRAYLEGEKAWVFNVHGGDNPFQEAGVPDLLACWRGQFVGVEVKQPGESPTRRQLAVLKRIKDAGGIAIIAESVEDVVKALDRASRRGVR